MAAEVIGRSKLIVKGYVYKRHSESTNRTWWQCVRYGKDESIRCRARASTSNIQVTDHKDVKLYRGPDISVHNHPPLPEEVELARKFRGVSPKPSNRQSPSLEQASSGGQVDSEKPNFMNDPLRYQEFLLKFTENPSFDRESIIRALDAVSNLGVSRTAACALVQSNQYKISADLDVLSSSLISTSSSSPSKASLANATDETFRPVTPPSSGQSSPQASPSIKREIDDTETTAVCHTPSRKKGKKENDKIMDILTSTIESTIETVQHIAELMQARKDKKKRKRKEKEDKRRVKKLKIKIIPPVPNSIPIRSLSSPESMPLPVASPVREIKDEFPVIDLTAEDELRLRNVSGVQPNVRIESMKSQSSCVFNASTVLFPDPVNFNNSYPLMNGHTGNSFLPEKPSMMPPMAQDFYYHPVTIQQLNFGTQYPNWDLNNTQSPLQNLRGVSNGFLPDMSHLRTFANMRQLLPITQDVRRN